MPYSPTWNNPYLTPAAMQAYYPYPQLPQQQMVPQASPQQTNIVKVNGPDSALQYPVAPNTQSPALFDNAGGVFYVVTADGAGSKTLEIFDYTEHVTPEPEPTKAQLYVTREEYTDLLSQVSDLRRELRNGIPGPVQQGTTAVGDTESESAAKSVADYHGL